MNRTLRNWLIWGGILALVAVGIALTWQGDDSGSAPTTIVVTDTAPTETSPPTTAEPTTTKFEANASTQLSCQHFRNVMDDAGNGLLTDAELRDKTKQFYDTGQRSNVTAVNLATQEMLRDITFGDTDGYLKAAKKMSDACLKYGL
jgi:hypothetical protein